MFNQFEAQLVTSCNEVSGFGHHWKHGITVTRHPTESHVAWLVWLQLTMTLLNFSYIIGAVMLILIDDAVFTSGN